MNRIEAQANYYRNLPLRDRSIKAVVHLEDSDDKLFWQNQLTTACPANYHFISYSKSNKGIDTRGCEQCLRYLPYLTKCFFICIDSDLRQLKGDATDLTADNCVAQTYAYSWENHFCEAENLQKRFQTAVPDSDFDFRIFLKHLSEQVYKPLLYLVYYSRDAQLNSLWNISRFNACIPLQPKREELNNNGEAYIARVAMLFEHALQNLMPPNRMNNEHFNADNAYLHIQGHQLYNLILYIGKLLCHGKKVAFKTDILDKASHTTGYEEINGVQADLNQILN